MRPVGTAFATLLRKHEASNSFSNPSACEQLVSHVFHIAALTASTQPREEQHDRRLRKEGTSSTCCANSDDCNAV